MSKEKIDTPQEIISAVKPASNFKPKILIIGLPIFVVQLVVVYFITANILLSGNNITTTAKIENKTNAKQEETSDKHNGESKEGSNVESSGNGLIYSVEDMIVNPAQTNGKMLLLASLGLSVDNEESKKALEEKQVVVKDAIISVLSSKSVNQLSSSTYRDTLKVEILKNLSTQLPASKVNNIYFSKFIIQ